MKKTYQIRRRSASGTLDELVATGLTLEEAQTWCRDPETSSRTCTTTQALTLAETHGPWFDGYEEER